MRNDELVGLVIVLLISAVAVALVVTFFSELLWPSMPR